MTDLATSPQGSSSQVDGQALADGRILTVVGPVIDVEFPTGSLPEINFALKFERKTEKGSQELTAEVAQHIGERVVRAIVMQPTDGVTRGTAVRNTGGPISVPVGPGILGHLYNVLGEPQDVLLFIDNIFRFVQAGSEVSTLLGRMPSAVGYQPTLANEMGQLQERITSTKGRSVTSLQAVYVPADDITDPAPHATFAHLDAQTVLSRSISELGIYPAVDPLDSSS